MTGFPRMKGNAMMAVGAGDFDVPLFSQIHENLWTGCSPAEFPDEYEAINYSTHIYIRYKEPVNCHWLYERDSLIEKSTDEELVLSVPPPRFDAILNLYPWVEYVVPEGVEWLSAELYDSNDAPSLEYTAELVDWVIERLKVGKRVLIHCQAGLNRSSFVAAVTLMRWLGISAADAIEKIRAARSPVCLCNQAFEAALRDLDVSEVGR